MNVGNNFTTSIRPMLEKIEITFWKFVIDLLTHSKWVRYSIQKTVNAYLFFTQLTHQFKYLIGEKIWQFRINQSPFYKSHKVWVFAIILFFFFQIPFIFFLMNKITPNFLPYEIFKPKNPIPSTGQQNILVIAIDRVDLYQNEILGIWLVAYIPKQTPIYMIPIYPTFDDQINFESVLANPFDLTLSGELPKNVIDYLRQKNIWWNGSIVIDRQGIAEVINMIGGIEVRGQWVKGEDFISNKQQVGEYSYKSLITQTYIFKGFCLQANKLIELFTSQKISTINRDHLKMKLNDEFWSSLSDLNQNPVCEFPLFEISRP